MEVTMTALEKIQDFLRRDPSRAHCDDCLSTVLNIKPRQQVQQKTSSLANDNRFWRGQGICGRCGDEKKVIRIRLALVS
jgi:hypothetical protein